MNNDCMIVESPQFPLPIIIIIVIKSCMCNDGVDYSKGSAGPMDRPPPGYPRPGPFHNGDDFMMAAYNYYLCNLC